MRDRVGAIAGQVAIHAVLTLFALMALLPFVWMFGASFKTYVEVLNSRSIFPETWSLVNYIEITDRIGFVRAFRNSATVAIPATAVVVITSTAAGYVFAKYRFPGRDLIFKLLLSTMMVPFAVALIPLFITMKDIGMINTLHGIILTSLCSTFGIFLMRQAIETIPNDYIDAARIDGAGELWILRQVIVPLSGAAISTLAVFTFLGQWDSYIWPSIMLKSAGKQTIPIVIAGMRSLYSTRYNIWAAGSMLTVVPVMLLFSIAQKQFIGGLSMAGLKG